MTSWYRPLRYNAPHSPPPPLERRYPERYSAIRTQLLQVRAPPLMEDGSWDLMAPAADRGFSSFAPEDRQLACLIWIELIETGHPTATEYRRYMAERSRISGHESSSEDSDSDSESSSDC